MNKLSFAMSQDVVVGLLSQKLGDEASDSAWKLSKESERLGYQIY